MLTRHKTAGTSKFVHNKSGNVLKKIGEYPFWSKVKIKTKGPKKTLFQLKNFCCFCCGLAKLDLT